MEKHYTCGVCKASYDTIEERAKCEAKCIEKRKVEEEKRKKAELEEAKKARKEELDLACKKYLELRNAYLKDYGHYTYSHSYDDKYESNVWEDFWRNW